MRDVSEVHERLFREGNSDTKFGAFRTKFWSKILEGNRDGGNRQIDDRRCPRGSSKKGSLLKECPVRIQPETNWPSGEMLESTRNLRGGIVRWRTRDCTREGWQCSLW